MRAGEDIQDNQLQSCMANLYTYMIKTMQQSKNKVKSHQEVVKKLISIINNVEILQEDPIFIDGIHGEQELSLDQALELLKAIKEQFIPLKPEPEERPLHEAGVSDVSQEWSIAHYLMEFMTGNEGRIPQWQIEEGIIRASQRAMQSHNPQERLIGLLSAQTLNKSTRKTDTGLSYN